jgi:DNA topoisomerase-1
MRTDSLRIADSALESTRSYVQAEYGDKYLPKKALQYGKEGAQDAHEAIRPVDVKILPSTVARFATPEQAKLYELIWRRFVACQMSQALYFQRQLLIGGGDYIFKATGSTLMFDGFLKVYSPEEDEEEAAVTIPNDIAKGNPLGLLSPTSKQHFTQPPPRYTEGSLVKEMEKCGIGRPSTYNATLSTLQKRAYIEKDKKRFVPTELGRAVNDLLCKHFPDIINITFTARMEEDLDKIAEGNANRDKVLTDFYTKFKEDLASFGESSQGKTPIPTDLHCPDCQGDLVIRFGKAGEFIGCSAFPTCKFTSNFTRTPEGKIEFAEAAAPVETGLKCPKCKKDLITRVGKFGPFMSCSGYPECKYIHQEKLAMPCPTCKGNVVKRKWRGGSFWGCSGYPDCKFAIFGEVLEEACPKGDSVYLLVTKDKEGNRKASCPQKTCTFSKNVD